MGLLGLAVWVGSPGTTDGPAARLTNVGHGDAIRLEGLESRVVIDGGEEWAAWSRVLPEIRAEGEAKDTVLLVSHEDKDHVEGALCSA